LSQVHARQVAHRDEVNKNGGNVGESGKYGLKVPEEASSERLSTLWELLKVMRRLLKSLILELQMLNSSACSCSRASMVTFIHVVWPFCVAHLPLGHSVHGM
jgi:hypothetical protein